MLPWQKDYLIIHFAILHSFPLVVVSGFVNGIQYSGAVASDCCVGCAAVAGGFAGGFVVVAGAFAIFPVFLSNFI